MVSTLRLYNVYKEFSETEWTAHSYVIILYINCPSYKPRLYNHKDKYH